MPAEISQNQPDMKKSLFILYIFCGLMVVGCSNKSRHFPQGLSSQIDSFFTDWDGPQPGGAVAIIEEGTVIYEKYFGMANLEENVAFSAETLTDIGSISKQFTACLIALLEEQQRLSIEDDIRKYLPEIPLYQDTVRIKHLLFHTSGIKDYEALELIKGRHYFDEHMSNSYVVELMARQESLNFSPGTNFEYSNSNYILLAEIIERISGKSLNDFAQQTIFIPLSMSSAFFHVKQGEDFPNKARGYEPTPTGFTSPLYRSHLIGDGGLYLSLTDMVKWAQNFYHNELGNGDESLMRRMKYREPLADGRPNFMAFAQIFTPHPFGENSWSHGGSGGGYRSFYIRLEKPELSVIVLANSDSHNAFEKANAIVNLFFNYNPPQPSTVVSPAENTDSTPPSFELTPDLIDRFSGYYVDEERISLLGIQWNDSSRVFEVHGLGFEEGTYPSIATNPTTLVEVADASYTYELDMNQALLIHKVDGVIERKWRKLPAIVLPPGAFEGKYNSPEIQHEVIFEELGSKLYAANPFLDSLKRVGNYVFFDEKSFAIVRFEVDESKQATGFRIDIPRGDRNLRNLQFIHVRRSK